MDEQTVELLFVADPDPFRFERMQSRAYTRDYEAPDVVIHTEALRGASNRR